MKLTASGRYIVYGGMDSPVSGEAKEVGIYDLHNGEARRVELPATCWHLAVHPTEDLFYPVSFRVAPQEGRDWKDWAIGFAKEYAFEIDAESGQVLRHWAVGRETPAHLNSDVTISDSELIFCNGASQSIVFIDLASFADWRFIDERPGLRGQAKVARQVGTQAYRHAGPGLHVHEQPAFPRRAAGQPLHRARLHLRHHAQCATRSLLFTANRGLNHITIYDYPANTIRLRVKMPDLHEYVPSMSRARRPPPGIPPQLPGQPLSRYEAAWARDRFGQLLEVPWHQPGDERLDASGRRTPDQRRDTPGSLPVATSSSPSRTMRVPRPPIASS